MISSFGHITAEGRRLSVKARARDILPTLPEYIKTVSSILVGKEHEPISP